MSSWNRFHRSNPYAPLSSPIPGIQALLLPAIASMPLVVLYAPQRAEAPRPPSGLLCAPCADICNVAAMDIANKDTFCWEQECVFQMQNSEGVYSWFVADQSLRCWTRDRGEKPWDRNANISAPVGVERL